MRAGKRPFRFDDNPGHQLSSRFDGIDEIEALSTHDDPLLRIARPHGILECGGGRCLTRGNLIA